MSLTTLLLAGAVFGPGGAFIKARLASFLRCGIKPDQEPKISESVRARSFAATPVLLNTRSTTTCGEGVARAEMMLCSWLAVYRSYCSDDLTNESLSWELLTETLRYTAASLHLFFYTQASKILFRLISTKLLEGEFTLVPSQA
jgi:hypothetical protein